MGLTRGKLEAAAAEHGSGQAGHERLSLDMEVPEEFIGAPATDEANPVRIDTGAEECHGATSAGGASGDVGAGVGQIGVEGQGQPQTLGDI